MSIMRYLRFFALLCGLILAGCVASPQKGSSTPSTGPVLVVNGELTQEGAALRDRGLGYYHKHRDVEAYADWRPLADQGHGESLFNMGIMTRDGLGVPADPAAGLEWMRKAASAGYASAYLDVGAAYSAGTLVPKNVDEAVRYWRKGAGLGCTACATAAGRYLVLGIAGATTDRRLGVALLTQAAQAEEPDANAQSVLGVMYIDGEFVPKNFAKARKLLEQAAKSCECGGDTQYHLGLIYDNGYGVPIDKEKAVALYEQAASKNNASAMNNLGYAYRHGEGVRKDLAKATEYFTRADALGNLDATINLGDMIFKGWGVQRDRPKAVELYKKAAEADAPIGKCRYAQALLYGDGTARNKPEALRWTILAKADLPKLTCDKRLEDSLY